jgi:hypothetical protein
MDVAHTDFKLIASHGGWQYTLHETGVSEAHVGNNEAKMHVTVGWLALALYMRIGP